MDSSKNNESCNESCKKDPKQCLPVIPKSSSTEIVDACIGNADFWGEVEVLHLSVSSSLCLTFRPYTNSGTVQAQINLLLLAAADRMTETERAKAQGFADRLLGVVDGSANKTEDYRGPTGASPAGDHEEQIRVNQTRFFIPSPRSNWTIFQQAKKSRILPRWSNSRAQKSAGGSVNDMVLDVMPGDAQTFY
ncbi:BQ5605_C002g01100 [Microbotryum silenes-dioicae]|uniref:BQ5605_C002g01100 protein n=1 Tax=Microbotryum silenes-dioicae TaxID=796604 RepID=A0A2X0M2B3_9BASI|nr:BQ5605_C002g01100 [Microbotryum silenes-dioicae]